MKKIDGLLLLLLATVSFAIGQPISKKADITWGNKLHASKRSTLSDVIGYDQNGMYAIRHISKFAYGLVSYFTLEHYDASMNLVTSTKIDLKYPEGRRELSFITHYNHQLCLFTSFTDKQKKIKTLYIQKVDKKTLMPTGLSEKIAEINYEGFRNSNSGEFAHHVSHDSTKLLVYYDLPYEKKEKDKFGIHVLDASLQSVWHQEITLPYQEELFDIQRYKVDNQGNVYLLGRMFYEKRKTKRKGEVNYQYHVLSYRNEGKTFTEYPVQLPDMFLTDMQIAISPKMDIICAGFYSEKGLSSIKGSYYLTIDSKTKEIKRKSFKSFDADLITQTMKKGSANSIRKQIENGRQVELYEYDLKDLIVREDGGAVLVGEQYYVNVVYRTNTNGMNTGRATYYYNYNNILVVNINPKGDIEWAQKIPKRQITKNDGGFFSSYALAVVEDKLLFVFNDNPKNLVAKPGKTYPMKLSKKSIVVMVEIDGQGKQTCQPMFMMADAKVITRPKVCEQIAHHEMIVFGQKGKTQRFARLAFKAAPEQISSK